MQNSGLTRVLRKKASAQRLDFLWRRLNPLQGDMIESCFYVIGYETQRIHRENSQRNISPFTSPYLPRQFRKKFEKNET